MCWLLCILLILIGIYAAIVLVYFFLQEKLLFLAGPRLQRKHRFRLASSYEEIYLESHDGSIVHGLHILHPLPKGLILYFHGNTGNLSRWATVAEEFTTYGYQVLVVDYRGFGKSEGKRSELALYKDAQLFYDHSKTIEEEHRIIVYGRSLGSGLAVKVAAENNPKQLILETPYFNLIEVAGHHVPFIPIRWVLRYRFRSDRYIKRVGCPIAIFHGTKDLIVPYSSGLKLYEQVKENSDNVMVTIPRGRHSNLNGFPLFREKMRELLGA